MARDGCQPGAASFRKRPAPPIANERPVGSLPSESLPGVLETSPLSRYPLQDTDYPHPSGLSVGRYIGSRGNLGAIGRIKPISTPKHVAIAEGRLPIERSLYGTRVEHEGGGYHPIVIWTQGRNPQMMRQLHRRYHGQTWQRDCARAAPRHGDHMIEGFAHRADIIRANAENTGNLARCCPYHRVHQVGRVDELIAVIAFADHPDPFVVCDEFEQDRQEAKTSFVDDCRAADTGDRDTIGVTRQNPFTFPFALSIEFARSWFVGFCHRTIEA